MRRLTLLAVLLVGAVITTAQQPLLHYCFSTNLDTLACSSSAVDRLRRPTELAVEGIQVIDGKPAMSFIDMENKLRTQKPVDIVGGEPYTICFWAYCPYESKGSLFEIISNDSTSQDYFQVQFRKRNEIVVNFQKPQVSILTKKRKNNSRITRQVIRYENCVVFKAPTFSLKDNTWHHYAIVCPDEDPHNIKVYFDGKELRGGRVVGDFLINTGKSHMVIGGKFEGYLSSIQVFGDVLTSNQIERMANAIN